MINDLQPKYNCIACGDEVAPRFRYCESCRKIATAEIHARYRRSAKGKAMVARHANTRARWRADNPERMKSYKRDWKLRTYGMTPEHYAELLKAQRGVCALCEKPETDTLNPFVVDHDHETGAVRGILHRKCNSMLGMADDDTSVLSMAVRYLMIRETSYA